ncbi:MAG: GNAT family N-acetyltransferase [Candidatus Micrarchaeaceae archaeon]
MEIKTRKILKKDIPKISKLILDIYKEKPYALTFEKLPKKEKLYKLLNAKVILSKKKLIIDKVIVDLKDNVLGELELIPLNNDLSNNLGIIGLIIDNKFRRKGIGTTLLNETIETAKKQNFKKILAIVSIDNKEAINFFKKNNFYFINQKNNINDKKLTFELKLD